MVSELWVRTYSNEI